MKKVDTARQIPTVIGLKLKSKRLPTWLADALRSGLNRLFGYAQFNELYSRLPEHEDSVFSKTLLDALNITLDVSGEQLGSHPLTGPQMFVFNHPHGLVDGFAVDHLITSLRRDARIMSMYILGDIPQLQKTLILVDPLKARKRHQMNVRGWRQSYRLLAGGGALVVFPAGAVSRFQWDRKKVADPEWNPHIAAIARRTGATVVPIFIHGRGGFMFQLAGMITNRIQNMTLFNELLKMKGRSLRITVGKPLPPETWSHISDDSALVNHFRDKVERLEQRN